MAKNQSKTTTDLLQKVKNWIANNSDNQKLVDIKPVYKKVNKSNLVSIKDRYDKSNLVSIKDKNDESNLVSIKDRYDKSNLVSIKDRTNKRGR